VTAEETHPQLWQQQWQQRQQQQQQQTGIITIAQ
jgi:hypothetical protein